MGNPEVASQQQKTTDQGSDTRTLLEKAEDLFLLDQNKLEDQYIDDESQFQRGGKSESEQSVYTRLRDQYNTDKNRFAEIVKKYIELKCKKTGKTLNSQEYIQELQKQFEGLNSTTEWQKEFAMKGIRHQFSRLKEDLRKWEEGTPQEEIPTSRFDPKKFDTLQKDNAEQRLVFINGAAEQYSTGPTDRLFQPDTLAAVGVSLFAATSALASLQGGGSEHSIILGAAAVLAGNYAKNKVAGSGIPNPETSEGKVFISDLAEKYHVDESFVRGMTSEKNSAWYNLSFGTRELKTEGFPEDLNAELSEVRKLNWELFQTINFDNLQSAYNQMMKAPNCWTEESSDEEKKAWIVKFLEKNCGGDPSFLAELQRGDYKKYFTGAMATQFYVAITGLYQQGVFGDKRKNAFIGIGKKMEELNNPSAWETASKMKILEK